MKEKLYCKSGGCSAKLGAKKLTHILEKIDKYPNSNLLVGFDSHDDASVYQINEHQAIVSTLDFFPPMVEDPYLFGQIAATNALSDVYAMGGTPLTALNIVCFNDQDDLNILGKIIEGGNDKLKEAKVVLSGGHSIKDESTKYGLSVTGIVDPSKMIQNNGVQVGDTLILTKKLGVGLTLNAYRLNDARQEILDEVFKSMTTLNKYAFDVLNKYTLHALTDVTGFGLLVHLDEMLEVDENCYEVQALIDQVQNQHDIEEIKVKKLSQEAFHQKNKTSQIIYVIFLHLIRFISSSIISSVIDVLLAWILLDVLKLWMTSDFWRIALSSLIARILSTIVNYVINKKYVFKGKNNSKQTARRFLILTIVITILSTLFVYAASSLHIMSEKLAKPIGDLLLFLLSYSAQTKWVFHKE